MGSQPKFKEPMCPYKSQGETRIQGYSLVVTIGNWQKQTKSSLGEHGFHQSLKEPPVIQGT